MTDAVQGAVPGPITAPARRRRVRWAVLGAAVLPAAILLAGCGSGQGNETSKEQSAVQAAHLTNGPVQIQDIYITPVGPPLNPAPGTSLAQSDSTVNPSPPPAPSLPASGQADGYLVATVINHSSNSDAVTGVTIGSSSTSSGSSPTASPTTAAESGTVALAPKSANLTVPPNGVLNFLDPADYNSGQGGPYLVLLKLTQPLVIGEFVPVTFSLASGETEPVQVPIISSFFGAPPSSPPVPFATAS